MDGNERYVKVRPNPDALAHVEIFDRLVRDGDPAAGGWAAGPTGPFVEEGRRLESVLDELATMVGQLGACYDAESIRLAMATIDAVRGHLGELGDHAAHLAREFDGYAETYCQVRSRMPEPVPFAAQVDAVEDHYPGLLGQVPFVAELREENEARTREARELYRRLDQAAVVADDATPAFPSLAGATTGGEEAAAGTAGAASLPSGSSSGVRGPSQAAPAGSMGPAGAAPSVVAPTTTPVSTGPAAMPGAGGGGGGPGTGVPQAAGTRAPGAGGAALRPGPQPYRLGGSGRLRVGRHHSGLLNTISGDSIGGREREGGRPGGGAGAPSAERPAASRAVPVRAGGLGPGPVGPVSGVRREEDREHRRPSYLDEGDTNAIFGTDQRVAPPVIGANAPGADHWYRRTRG